MQVQIQSVLASTVSASAKLSGLACLLPMPMPDLADISRAPVHLQVTRKGTFVAFLTLTLIFNSSTVFSGQDSTMRKSLQAGKYLFNVLHASLEDGTARKHTTPGMQQLAV